MWGQIAHSVAHLGNGFGQTMLVEDMSRSLWSWITGERIVAGGIGLVAGLAALALGATTLLPTRHPRTTPS